MKFTQYLLQNLIPEWVKLYVNFKLLKTYLSIMTILKAFLLDAKQQKPRDEYSAIKESVLSDQGMVDKLNRDVDAFLRILDDEIKKYMNFALFKFQDLVQKQNKLKQQCYGMEHERNDLIIISARGFQNSWNQSRKQQHSREVAKNNRLCLQEFRRKESQLQDSFFRFYVEIQQLQQFIEKNNEAIRKIVKKYKKQEIRGIHEKHENDLRLIQEQSADSKLVVSQLKKMKDQTETHIIKHFYKHENPKKCREFLRKYTSDQHMTTQSVFYFGFFAGFGFVCFLILVVLRYDGYLDPNSDKVFNKLFPCFRGIALFIFYYWMIALDVAGWNYFNINYKIYLGFNFHFSTLTEILKRVTTLSTLYMVCFVLYLLQEENLGQLAQDLEFFKPHYYPLIVWSVTLFYVFYPTKRYFNPQGRRWMYTVLYGTFWAHLFAYESRYTFMADQLCSFTTPIRDLDYTICYYFYWFHHGHEHDGQCDPRLRFTSALPATIPYSIKCLHYITRGRQKGKFWGTDEMWNFFKTLNAVNVGVWSYIARKHPHFRLVWVVFAIISTFWQYWWDLKKDFLLFESDSKYKFLRNDLGYNSPKIYYTLAVLNFFLRCTWTLSLSPDMYKMLGLKNEIFVLIVGMLEMSRRFLNNFLKMEKEHITNLRSLKAVQDLKYPFKFEQEMKVANESCRWSVSSFQRENSGFLSFDQVDEFENKPEEVQVYRGISQQVPSGRESIISQKSRVAQDYLKTIVEQEEDLEPKNRAPQQQQQALQQPLLLLEPSQYQSLFYHHPSMIETQSLRNYRLITPYHSRNPSKELKLPKKEGCEREILMARQIDTKCLEQAKKKEKLEQQKILELKSENRKYKQKIDSLYKAYQVQSNQS